MVILLLFACAKAPTPPVSTTRSLDLGPSLRAELVKDGTVENRLAEEDDAELILYYLGEQRGSIAPCGCPDNPRGGLPRAASYLEKSTPGLVLNTGYWMDDGQGIDGQPRADAKLKNQWMIRGLTAMQPDAIHVSFNDLFGLATLPEQPVQLPLVSANIQGAGIAPYIIVEHAEKRIGITGISNTGHPSIQTPGFERLPAAKAAAPIIKSLRSDTDTVVLFAHGVPDEAKKLARTGNVDVIIDTNAHRVFEPPFRVDGALWVRSHAQGMRLGELRLGPDMTWALDRKIELDENLPDHTKFKALHESASSEIEALEKMLFSR